MADENNTTPEAQGTALLQKALSDCDRALAQNPPLAQEGALRGRRFQIAQKLQHPFLWMSQAGQDLWIDQKIFSGQRGGSFVEVGAFDGLNGSNTWFLENFRHWKGLLVEPSPTWAAACRAHRTAPVLQVAAGGSHRRARFFDVEKGYTMMGGLIDNYNPDMMGQVKDDPRFQGREIEVQVRPLADILREHGLSRVDYISLDVEGAEVEVLQAFPFDEIPVTVWSVENHDLKPEIDRIMTGAGYVRDARIGVDDIWKKA